MAMRSIVTARDDIVEGGEVPVVLAIGAFDGIHIGHQAVIDTAKNMAKKCNAFSVLYSFRPHPSVVLGNPKSMILTSAQKRERICLLSIDYFVEQCFDEVFSRMQAEEFVIFLQRKFRQLKGICVGENFRFGKDREGDAIFLQQLSGSLAIEVQPSIFFDHQRVSSSNIRKCLSEGHIDRANRMLGYSYYIRGKIIKGRGAARKWGVPTMNVQFDNSLLLKFGVYLVRYQLEGDGYAYGIANFGVRPTFIEGISSVILEVHSLDPLFVQFHGDEIEVQFIDFIREEKKFTTQALLVEQIRRDIIVAKKRMTHLL